MRALGPALALLLTLGLAGPATAEPVVVTQDDAVHARAGRDYTRLATLHLGEDEYANAVTASGKVVLTSYDDRGSHFRLFDPETGRRTYLPAPGRYPTMIDISAPTIWYDVVDREGLATVYRFDRSSKRMRSFRLPDASQHHGDVYRVIGVQGRTVWYTSGPRQEHSSEDVWSVRFGRPHSLAAQGRRLGNPTFVDGVLAWSEYGIRGPSHFAMRDVATGEVTRAELPDGCAPRGDRVQSSDARRFVLILNCDLPEIEAAIIDRSGEVTTIIQVAMDDGSLGTTDRGVFFYDLFYDVTTGRLLDYSDIGNSEIDPAGGPGDHPVQVWPQRDGRALVVRLK